MKYRCYAALFAFFTLTAPYAKADSRTDCPSPPATCKIIVLNAEEERILMDEKGILATAAQARSLDLGALVTYFQQKIAKAPAGDVKETPKPAPSPTPAPAPTPPVAAKK
jgi:hypothetical protein